MSSSKIGYYNQQIAITNSQLDVIKKRGQKEIVKSKRTLKNIISKLQGLLDSMVVDDEKSHLLQIVFLYQADLAEALLIRFETNTKMDDETYRYPRFEKALVIANELSDTPAWLIGFKFDMISFFCGSALNNGDLTAASDFIRNGCVLKESLTNDEKIKANEKIDFLVAKLIRKLGEKLPRQIQNTKQLRQRVGAILRLLPLIDDEVSCIKSLREAIESIIEHELLDAVFNTYPTLKSHIKELQANDKRGLAEITKLRHMVLSAEEKNAVVSMQKASIEEKPKNLLEAVKKDNAEAIDVYLLDATPQMMFAALAAAQSASSESQKLLTIVWSRLASHPEPLLLQALLLFENRAKTSSDKSKFIKQVTDELWSLHPVFKDRRIGFDDKFISMAQLQQCINFLWKIRDKLSKGKFKQILQGKLKELFAEPSVNKSAMPAETKQEEFVKVTLPSDDFSEDCAKLSYLITQFRLAKEEMRPKAVEKIEQLLPDFIKRAEIDFYRQDRANLKKFQSQGDEKDNQKELTVAEANVVVGIIDNKRSLKNAIEKLVNVLQQHKIDQDKDAGKFALAAQETEKHEKIAAERHAREQALWLKLQEAQEKEKLALEEKLASQKALAEAANQARHNKVSQKVDEYEARKQSFLHEIREKGGKATNEFKQNSFAAISSRDANRFFRAQERVMVEKNLARCVARMGVSARLGVILFPKKAFDEKEHKSIPLQGNTFGVIGRRK